jgi:hypothetical protein
MPWTGSLYGSTAMRQYGSTAMVYYPLLVTRHSLLRHFVTFIRAIGAGTQEFPFLRHSLLVTRHSITPSLLTNFDTTGLHEGLEAQTLATN